MPQNPTSRNGASAGALGLLRAIGRRLLLVPRPAAALLALAWMALIFWVSSFQHIKGPEFMAGSGFYGNFAHAVEFGLLALWLVLATERSDDWLLLAPATVRKVFLVCVLYGGLDEFHQMYVPGRSASLFDLLTNAAGAFCTLWIVWYGGRAQASSRGVVWRLALGVVFTASAASASTLWDEWARSGV